ncbi:MAG: hypothetical protein KJ053_12655 [Dehalococcoidia bacterium]|nr:hypothetical protein [Dehalococcoidia bacterium]
MRRAIVPLLVPSLLLALIGSACGGNEKDGQDTPTAPASEPVTDKEYLKVICTGTKGFSDALVSQTTAEGIAGSITGFIASLKQTTPPADLQQFHQDLIKYLEDSVSDPTSLVTKKRPQPPEKVRERLAATEAEVPECTKAHYFVTE